MQPEDVSVIIPAYCAARTVRRALKSVAEQTVKPGEVVIVDDGSKDDTFDVAKACRTILGDIPLILERQNNAGAGAARNHAIRLSRGKILAFLDADDEWLPQKLQRSLMHMGNNILVAHNSWIVKDGKVTLNDSATRFHEGSDPFVILYRKSYLDTCTILTWRDAVLAVGGFDERLPNGQDFDLWLALLEKPGTPFLVFEEPLCRYHVTPGSIMSYTERRRTCVLRIAGRYIPALRARSGLSFVSLWWRLLAIHYEIFSVYKSRHNQWVAVWTLFRLPWNVIQMSIRFIFTRPIKRINYIRKKPI